MKTPALSSFPWLAFLAVIMLSILVGACGVSAPPPPPPEPVTRDLYGAVGSGAVSGSTLRPPARSLGKRMDDPAPLAEPWPEPAPGAPLSPPGRMVAHEGAITARASEPEALLDSAEALARARGGFSEARSKGRVRLRVPTPAFDSVFAALMEWGDIVAHSRRAQDVTEEFQDADLRQRVVETAIARLETLLKRAQGDGQKLRLIQRLKAYREEWETLKARKEESRKRAELAAITFEVQGRSVGVEPRAAAEFPEFDWIRTLTPFNEHKGGSRLRFDAPAGFAPTSRRGGFGIWRATAPDGAEMSAWTQRPGLEAGSGFWRDAVRLRLAPQFKRVDSLEAGDFRFLRFTSHGPRVYEYWVGVAGEDARVRVVEFYFPDTLQRVRYSAALLAAVKKGPRWW